MSDKTTPADVFADAGNMVPPTAEAVLAALEAAHIAMTDAALLMAMRYGQGSENATQLAGAAALITHNWMPAIRDEVMQ